MGSPLAIHGQRDAVIKNKNKKVNHYSEIIQFSRSVMSDSLRPHGEIITDS